MLFKGWLYIVNDSWNVQSLQLSHGALWVYEYFVVNYTEIKPSVFLPITYSIRDSIHIGIGGIDGVIRYYASIKYKKIEINEFSENMLADKIIPISAPDTLIKKAKEKEDIKIKKQQKQEKELETLLSKENLSNRDAYKIAQLMQEATEPEESKQKRDSLEIIPQRRNTHITVDSLAKLRDSAYWEEIRTLPLQQEEIISFKRKDTINAKFEKVNDSDSIKKKSNSWYWKIFVGSRVKIGKNYWFRYGGLLRTVPEYNFVDGVWLGQKLTFERIDTLKKPHEYLPRRLFCNRETNR
jgi:hypothetical protein